MRKMRRSERIWHERHAENMKTDKAWEELRKAFGCIECKDAATGERWRLVTTTQFHPLDKYMFIFKHRNYNGLGQKEFIVEI